MALYQKAYICPMTDKHIDLGNSHAFNVQFNPSEISIEEAIGVSDIEENDYKEDAKRLLSGSYIGWQRSMEGSFANKKSSRVTLSMTLFFNTLTSLYQDSYEDVRNYVSKLYYYTNNNIAKGGKPQQICFFWGSIAVSGILSKMSVRYTMFAPDGKPVRAQTDISITGEYLGDKDIKAYENSSAGKQSLKQGPLEWRDIYSGTGNPRLM